MKIKSICCNYEFDVKYVSKDSLGYCTTCPCCHGSFDVDMRMLTLTEFHALKKGDKVFVRVHDTLVESEIMNKPFYNSDADEPDWEVETSNGFCDIYSLYKLNNEIEKGNDNMNNDMETRVETVISYLFGKYDMKLGEDNKNRMQKVLEFCMEDIRMHPSLERELDSNEKLEFFIIQSLICMIKE